jgi:hypothetical protein
MRGGFVDKDRMAAIRELTKDAERWLEAADDTDLPHEWGMMCAAIANAKVNLARLHVEMGEWPIDEDTPA